MRDYSVREVTGLIKPYGAPSARMVQFYIEKGMVIATGGGGRGRHRQIPRSEVPYAALVGHLDGCGFATADIADIIVALRNLDRYAGGNSLFELVAHDLRLEMAKPLPKRNPPRLHLFRNLGGELVAARLTGDALVETLVRFPTDKWASELIVELDQIVEPLLDIMADGTETEGD